MSMSNSPMDPNEWGPPYSMFTPPPPPPQMPTPPVPNGSGVWSPPYGGRNGSPMGLYSHSPSYSQSPNMGMYGPTYQMEAKIDYNSLMFPPEPEANQRMQHHNHHHSVVGMERYHQQQIRRGSPLAQVGHPLPEEDNEAALIGGHGPMIDAPVPKHRHQLSISLQKELEGVENYQRQNDDPRQADIEMNPDGFNTNPVSPAPVVTYPEQPEIPRIEHDVHNGPELRSNPDDDVSDEEAEKNLNLKVALERERDLEAVRHQSYPEETATLAMPEVEVPGSRHYVSQQYNLPRRENSLGHIQHDHATADSRSHSAMPISYQRFSLKYDQPPDWLSEGARTNISEEEVITNPSQPPSPQRDFANPTNSNSHAHHMSNNSNAWTSDNAKPTASVTSSTSKFNAQAKEFEFRPSSFSFSPKIAPFIPSGSVTSSPISGHSRNHSRNQSGGGFNFGFFGGTSFNAGAATFRPSFTPGSNSSLFEKGAAAFSPNAPPFTPSALAKSVPASQPPPPAVTQLPPIFSPVDTSSLPLSVKKALPIRPPSRLNVHPETEAEESADDRKVGPSVDEGGGKRAKHGPALSVIKDTEVPSLESLTPTKEAAAELDANSDDATAVVESGDESEGEKLIKAVSIVSMGEEAAADGTHSTFTFKNPEETAGFAMADTRWDGPSRRQSRFDVFGSTDPMSVDEAQFVAADTPRDSISERSPTPHVEAPPKRFNPDAKLFSFKPTAQEFNSESTLGPNPPSPLSKKFGGMGDSRYAHTPSPPPSHPAPPPPSMLDNVPAFTPPTETSPYSANTDPYKTNAFGEPILRPMPTDAELDEVIQHLTVADPTFADQDEQVALSSDGEVIGQEQEVEEGGVEEEEDRPLSPWRHESPKRMGVPDFGEPTPRTTFRHLDRSAGPSPSPRRVAGAPYVPHRASSFSPDEAEYGRAQTTAEAVAYQPPTQEGIGMAKDPESDWDSMVSASEDTKLRPQSRLFFDAHVEDLVGGLLRSNLEPMNKNITAIHEVLKTYSSVYDSRSRRGSNISAGVNSDADDEDDEDNIIQPPRSPRKDRRSEKIKSAVVEALSMHNWSAPVEDKLAEIYGAIAKVSRAFQDGNLNGDLAETSASILDAILKTAQSEDVAALRDAVRASTQDAANNAQELGEFRAMFVNSFSKLAQVQDVNALRETLEEMFPNIPSSGDLVDVKLGLQEILVKTSQTAQAVQTAQTIQRGDVGELHAAVTRLAQIVARGEDLDHFQNVAIEAFSKLVKPNDLIELKATLSEIQRSVADVNFGSEVRKLGLDNTTLKSTLDEVLKLTQDTAENVDFHQESQESIIKDNHEAVRDTLNIMQSSIRDLANLVRSRVPENDLHSSLYNENFAQIKLAIENVRKGMQVGLESQRGLYGLKDVVEKVSDSQLGLGQMKEAISEVALPGLQDIKTAVEGVANTQPKLDDFRGVVEELLLKHNAGVGKGGSSADVDGLQSRIVQLERMLAEAESRAAEGDAKLRVESKEREVELETRLRMAEEECTRQREFVEERDRRLKAVEEKRHQTLTQTHMRSVLLEGAHSSLQRSVTDLSTRNVTLESSVREAQQTTDRLREDNRKMEEENKELRRAIDTMRTEMEESIRVRENHRGKFDKMQEDITTAAEEIGKEQSKWQRTHEEQKARIEVLEARLQAELTTKEILGGEVRRLEAEQKEAIRVRVEFEQVKKANGKMEEMLEELKKESIETQKRIVALNAEVEQARGEATQKGTSTEAAAVQVALEEEIEIAHDRIDRLTEENALEREKATLLLEETVKAHEVMLREAEEAKATIIKEAAEAKSTALNEQHRRFERQLETVRSKQEELRYKNERALKIATEDLEREKYLSSERLSIASSESKSLREYISHLKEQVQVATSAAQAAAQAATSAKLLSAHPTHGAAEERALRESVEVLQSQLQQREARIEQLEQELSQFDKADVKRKDEQITWLRELLEVRVDELEEIVHSLGLPYFDRESIRDAALRLKTNLQMEQQEKERTLRNEAAPATNPLTSRLPAWASWRGKGTGTPSQASSTPSRPTSAAGFLNGILTPPSGTLANAQRFGSRLARGSSTQDDSTQKFAGSARQREKQPARRAHLFRPASYDADADADSSVFSGNSPMYDGEDDDDATERGEDDDRDLGTIGLGLYKRH